MILLADETGHSFRARLTTTWARTGHPPELRRVDKRREMSSIVALTAPGPGRPARVYARHFHGAVHGAEVIEALRSFRRRVGQPVVVVWDRLNAHRSREVQDFVAAHAADFAVEFLPPYAPDLNPEEGCNSIVKNELRNATPTSVEDLRRQVTAAFRRLNHRPQTLANLFRRSRLSLQGIP